MRNRISSKTGSWLGWIALAALLSGADFIWTPHSPLHHLPQTGIYLLTTLIGIGVVLGITLALRRVLQRGEGYYDEP